MLRATLSRRARCQTTFRPRGALVDPCANQRDLSLGQRIAGLRHPALTVESEQSPNHQALLAVAGDDGRAAFAALHRGSAQIETQPLCGALRSVAAVTAAFENGLDVAREIDRRRRYGRGVLGLK